MPGAAVRRWHPRLWWGALVLFAVPVLAQFLWQPAGMDWAAGDFLAFASMLVAAVAAGELVLHLRLLRWQRQFAGTFIVAAFLVLWADLTIGIAGPG